MRPRTRSGSPSRTSFESPWVSWRLGLLESRDDRSRLSVMVALLVPRRRDVADGAVESPPSPPVDPCRGGQLDLFGRAPWSAPADQLGLVETHHGLGQGVVVAVAARTDRGDRAFLSEPLGVANGEVLHAAARNEVATRQPTMARLKASTMKAV